MTCLIRDKLRLGTQVVMDRWSDIQGCCPGPRKLGIIVGTFRHKDGKQVTYMGADPNDPVCGDNYDGYVVLEDDQLKHVFFGDQYLGHLSEVT